jgi:hypothetical protein
MCPKPSPTCPSSFHLARIRSHSCHVAQPWAAGIECPLLSRRPPRRERGSLALAVDDRREPIAQTGPPRCTARPAWSSATEHRGGTNRRLPLLGDRQAQAASGWCSGKDGSGHTQGPFVHKRGIIELAVAGSAPSAQTGCSGSVSHRNRGAAHDSSRPEVSKDAPIVQTRQCRSE